KWMCHKTVSTTRRCLNMKNTKTEHKYNYEGKTYFFESEKNLDLFRDNPEKYLGVVTFIGSYNTIQRGSGEKIWYDDIETLRLDYLYEIKSFSAYVNRQQWQDPTYGTKENPVPIFFKRALSWPESLGGMEAWETIKPSVNKKFVELYLAHELSSKEFNRLYGEDMKRLGLKD
ncbi:MAG: YHS domain-containing protein, partial [Prevotella melaninogenica]